MDDDLERLRFKSADDLLVWVCDCHAAGEPVVSSDDARLREIAFSIPGVYGYVPLNEVKEHPPTRKVLARFQPIPDWVWSQCQGNLLFTCASREWVARKPRMRGN